MMMMRWWLHVILKLHVYVIYMHCAVTFACNAFRCILSVFSCLITELNASLWRGIERRNWWRWWRGGRRGASCEEEAARFAHRVPTPCFQLLLFLCFWMKAMALLMNFALEKKIYRTCPKLKRIVRNASPPRRCLKYEIEPCYVNYKATRTNNRLPPPNNLLIPGCD